MSMSISPSGRGRSWLLTVTALCVFLGMLLALSLKTQRQAASEGASGRSYAVKTESWSIKRENDKLRKDLTFYKSRLEELTRATARGESGSKALQRQLDEAKMLAGLVGVRGPGVIVTLRDSPKLDKSESRPEIIEQYMVHEQDIRAVVNELFSAGAEAISINGERLIATSSIRCTGTPITINLKRCQSPFVIKAVGSPIDLQKALETQGAEADGLTLLDMLKIERRDDIVVPAYVGSTNFSYAHPVAEKQG